MNLCHWVQEAIVSEASARKLGNVHPKASFHDMSFEHFLDASNRIADSFQHSLLSDASIGVTILSASQAMMTHVKRNTSLGTILLLAPLVHTLHRHGEFSPELLDRALNSMTYDDAHAIYESIRICQPGGLGKSEKHDVQSQPPESILEAMRFAADRDDIALQFINRFEQVLAMLRTFRTFERTSTDRDDTIRRLQIDTLSKRLDSLVRRKVGDEAAERIRQAAAKLVATTEWGSHQAEQSWDELDRSMRDPANRLNPGTTADLIAAVLFLHIASKHGVPVHDA